jgi:uncharacterized cupin superfamily protein
MKIVFPADRSDPEYKEHEGEEWIYVLSGRLRLMLAGEATVLEPGDAAYFNGLLPHRWDVLGEEDVEMLAVGCRAGSGSGIHRRLHPLTEGHRGQAGAQANPHAGRPHGGHPRGGDGR